MTRMLRAVSKKNEINADAVASWIYGVKPIKRTRTMQQTSHFAIQRLYAKKLVKKVARGRYQITKLGKAVVAPNGSQRG